MSGSGYDIVFAPRGDGTRRRLNALLDPNLWFTRRPFSAAVEHLAGLGALAWRNRRWVSSRVRVARLGPRRHGAVWTDTRRLLDC